MKTTTQINQKLILLVDDSKAIRSALVWILEEEGYCVSTAENGQIALEKLEQDPLPSLIILDLMMPVMDGVEFRTRQKETPRIQDIPVIFTSAKNNLEKHFEPLPNKMILPKPFDIDYLLTLIAQFCKK